jgi:hypothetical protein
MAIENPLWARRETPDSRSNRGDPYPPTEAENETRRGRMRVPFPIDTGDEGLCYSYAAADMNRRALGPHGARFVA